jgi:hypothetical protein
MFLSSSTVSEPDILTEKALEGRSPWTTQKSVRGIVMLCRSEVCEENGLRGKRVCKV